MKKTNKVTVCPAKTPISLGICPVWSVFSVCMKKARILSYPLSAQRTLWLDWADAQADLSLRWAHSHLVGFVMSAHLCKGLDIWYTSWGWGVDYLLNSLLKCIKFWCPELLLFAIVPFHIVTSLTVHSSIENWWSSCNQTMGQVIDLVHC